MQTIQFVNSLRKLVVKLKAQELVDFLTDLVNAPPNANPTSNINESLKAKFSELIFESRVGLYDLRQNSHTEKLVIALGISDLYNPAKLGKLVSIYLASPHLQNIKATPDSFSQFYSFYSLLRWLLIFEKMCSELLEKEKVGDVAATDGVLELQIIDYDQGGIEAERMRELLSDVITLHTNVARSLGISDSHLRIRFADSGSDIVIAIQALKPVIDTLKGLFGEFWTKIRYKDLEDFDKKIDSLSKGLTFVAILNDQVAKKAITQEEADNLKVRVIAEMTKIMGNGGTLASDDEAVELVDRRKILTEKRGIKLLGSGAPPDDGAGPK